MWYLSSELKKIRRSKQLLFSFILIFIIVAVYYPVNNIASSDMSMFKFIFRVYGLLGFFPLSIPPVLFISLLFAKEFQDRTMTYIFLRPIKYYKLFLSKIFASAIYSSLIATIYFAVTVVYGFFFFIVVPFEHDSCVKDSMIRCCILFLYTLIGLLLISALSCFISIFVRHMFGSVIITFTIWIINSFFLSATFYLMDQEFKAGISTYLNPAAYSELDLNLFVDRFIAVTILNLVVVLIGLFISYRISLKYRKGKKVI